MVKNNLAMTWVFLILFGGLLCAASVQEGSRSRQTVSLEVKARAAEMSSRLAQLEKIVAQLRSSHLRFRTTQGTATWEELLSNIAKNIKYSSKSLSARPFIDPEALRKLAESATRLGAFMGVKMERKADANRSSHDQELEDVKRQKQQEMFDKAISESKEAADSAKEQVRMALRILKEIEERQSQNIAAVSRI